MSRDTYEKEVWHAIRTDRNAQLWLAVVLLYVVGDVTTTVVGLQLGMQETTGTVRWLLSTWGVPGFVAAKAIGCAAVYGYWRAYAFYHATRRIRWLFPAVMAAVGGYATIHNAAIILS